MEAVDMPKDLTALNTEPIIVDIENVDGTVDFTFGDVGTPESISTDYNDNAGRVGYDNMIYTGAVDPNIRSDQQGQYQLLNSSSQLNTANSEFIGISRFDMRGGSAYSPSFASTLAVTNSATGSTTQANETYGSRGLTKSRDITDGYEGYLLTDPFHYPMMENGIVKHPATPGDKIDSILNGISLISSHTAPYVITDIKNRVSFKVNNSGTVLSNTLTNGTKAIDDIVTELNTLFGTADFEFSNASGYLKVIGKTNTYSLEFFEETTSAFPTFGFTYGIYRKESNRIISVTKSETGYTPDGLLACTPFKLTGNTISGGVPQARNPWIYIVQNDTAQNFVVDMLNMPFESERRDWRETAPHWETGNAICQNKQCPIGQRGWTVDQWKAYVQSGTNQSWNMVQTNSTKCSECGFDLTTPGAGAVQIGGDGVKTYTYQDYFAEDAFITKIKVDSMGSIPTLMVHRTSYSVQIKASTNDYWETVLSVFYIQSQDKYFWIDDKGVEHLETSVPIEWDFRKRRLRARYIRFTSTSNRYPIVFEGAGLWDDINKRYNIQNDFIEGYFVGCKIETGTAYGTYTNTKNITNNNKVSSGGLNYVRVDGAIPVENVYYKITKYQFIGGCAKFEVYGTNYLTSDITITPSAEIETFSFTGGATQFTMTNQPTQIVGVWAGNVESNVELEPVDTIVPSSFTWITKIFEVNDTNGNPVSFKLLMGGKYYYQYSTNNIILPTVDQYGQNIYAVNQNIDPTVFSREVIPSTVTVKYWQGAGVGITFDLQADGRGPSYQVEREAVNEILSVLDGLGKSVPLGGNGKEFKRDVKWYCYNHDPVIWQTQTKTLFGNELGSDWSIGKFKEIFGQHATLVGAIPAKGTVTIYGASDVVLSGTLLVQAPPITTHTIGAYTWTEKTGGINEPGFLIEIDVNKEGGHRKSLAYSAPGIIIYAKEKTLDSKMT